MTGLGAVGSALDAVVMALLATEVFEIFGNTETIRLGSSYSTVLGKYGAPTACQKHF